MNLDFKGIIQRLKRNPELGYVMLANLISALLAGILWLVLAYIMSANDYGAVNYSLAIAVTFGTLSTLGLNTTLMTFIPKGIDALRKQALLASLSSAIICSVPVFILVEETTAVLFLVGYVTFSLSSAEALGSRAFKSYAILTIGQKVMQMGLGILLYFLLGIEGVVLGYSLSYLIFSYRIIRHFRVQKPFFSELRGRGRFIVHSLSFEMARNITINSDKIIIAPLYGFTILGMYQLGVQFLMLLGMVPTVLYSYLLPQEAAGIKSAHLRKKSILLSAILSIIVIVSSPFAVPFFFPHHTESVRAVQILSAAVVPLTISVTVQSSLLALQRSKPVFIGALLYLISQIILMTTLGAQFGVEGLASATLVAISLEAVWLLYSQRRLEKSEE